MLNARLEHSHPCEPKALRATTPRPARAGRWALPLLAILVSAALAPAVRAQSVSSTTRPGVAVYGTPRIINVGILRLGGPTAQNTVPAYPASGPPTAETDQFRGAYIFYILNQRPDILPNVWTLKNPNAPARVDAAITARFPTVNSGYNQDDAVTPSMAPYWEIDGDTISTTLGLSAYDLIVITTSGSIALTLEQRRALRQFVDKGGTLWIDTVPGSGSIDPSMIFHTKFGSAANALTATSANDLSHPLATGYYTLSSNDLDSLGTGFQSGRQILSAFSNGTPDVSLFHAVNTFASGATGSNFGSIAAANYGNGHILITDRDIADAINNGVGLTTGGSAYVGTAANQGGFCGTDFLAAPAADLKFVVNVLAWATNASGPAGGGRGTNAQPGASTGALQSNWTFPAAGQTLSQQYSPIGTATYGDRVFVTSSDGYVRAFDMNPGESLAYGADQATTGGDDYVAPGGASDPVTGVAYNADYSKGYPYDEIWALAANNGPVSAPVVAEMPAAPAAPAGTMTAVNTPEVLTETAAGAVSAANAVSGTLDYMANGDNAKFAAALPVPAPTYYRGRIYATQADGYVMAFAPPGTTPLFKTQVEQNPAASLSSPFVQSIPGSDTKGYNGEDVVAYVYDVAGSPVSNIYALFLGSRDEHEQYLAYNAGAGAGTSTYETIEQSISGLAGLTVTGAPEDTDDLTAGENDWLFDFPFTTPPSQNIAALQAQSNPGIVATNTIQNAAVPDNIYSDYDLASNGTQPNMIRTTVNANLAASTTQTASIQGMAVSSVSQGIAASLSNVTTAFNTANDFYVTVNETSNTIKTGYIMAVKERSPTVSTNTALIPWRFALVSGVTDAEGVTYNFGGYQFYGAPVSDGNGYVYALATNGTNTILMAFFANAVCGFIAPFTATSVTQTDELANTETILNSQFANNTFTNFSPTANTGTMQPNLTMPLPVTIAGASANGGPQSMEQVPVSTAQGAQPLLAWWVQLPVSLGTGLTAPQVTPTSALRKIGNTLYFGGQETSTGATATATDYALFAVYADPFGIGIQPDPVTRQIASSDYRLVQVTPSGIGPISQPPAGTGKYVVTAASPYTPSGATATAAGGVEGLGYVPTLVTDNHRLVELDPSGNATWVVDSTREPITQQIAGAYTSPNPPPTTALKTIVPLNRPTSLTQFSTDDYLLADTGNNRVIHIGRIGDVLTEFPDKYGHTLLATTRPQTSPTAIPAIPHALEITGFTDPSGILAPGEPLTLNQPSNVTFWTTYDLDPSVATNTPNAITAHYLICDTGNHRIVEIDDTYTLDTTNFTAAQATYDFYQDQDYHHLVWVTKTTANGHNYQYTAAQALFDSTVNNPLVNGPVAIAGAVSNAFVSAQNDLTGLPSLDPASGLPTADVLSAPNQDSQGSAVLLFAYAPLNDTYTGTSGKITTANPYAMTTHDGLPFVVVNSILADGAPTLAQQPKQSNTAPTTPYLGYPLRGLRSIQIYNFAFGQPAVGNNAAVPTSFGMTIADDDGVFDGSYLSLPNNNSVVPGTNTPPMTMAGTALDAYTADYGWSFRGNTAEDDYTPLVAQYDQLLDVKNNQPLNNPTGMTLSSTDYVGTSFSPASALRLANSTFLIVNRGGSGNPNGVPAFPATGETGLDFGGNVFAVRAKPGANGLRTNGGTLAGVMFGKPANTSALDGPSFALKSN